MRAHGVPIASLLAFLAVGCGGEAPAVGERPDTAAGAADLEETASADPSSRIPPGDSGGTVGPEPAESPPAGQAARPDPPSGEGWTVGIVTVEKPVRGAALLVRVETGRHPGYDRIVFEFEDGLPGYHLEYVDRPVRQCGSGEPVPLAGDAWLAIRLSPARAHTEEGRPTIEERERRPGLPNVRELELTCDFEAHVEWVAGVGMPNPYRVLELTGPARLVVDIRR